MTINKIIFAMIAMALFVTAPTARNAQTGFTRSDVSDAEGIYRLNALRVGTYDLTAELSGFNKRETTGSSSTSDSRSTSA